MRGGGSLPPNVNSNKTPAQFKKNKIEQKKGSFILFYFTLLYFTLRAYLTLLSSTLLFDQNRLKRIQIKHHPGLF